MITVLTRDLTTLPAALLPEVKEEAEVDHTDRDALITRAIAFVIERFEINNGVAVFEASYLWRPDEWSNGRIVIPRPPVASFTAQAGDPLADVSAAYSLATNGWGGEIAATWLVGAWQSGLELTVDAGYSDATLPPGIRTTLVRVAAHVYEYRGIYIGTNLQTQATAVDNWLAGYWQAYA